MTKSGFQSMFTVQRSRARLARIYRSALYFLLLVVKCSSAPWPSPIIIIKAKSIDHFVGIGFQAGKIFEALEKISAWKLVLPKAKMTFMRAKKALSFGSFSLGQQRKWTKTWNNSKRSSLKQEVFWKSVLFSINVEGSAQLCKTAVLLV